MQRTECGNTRGVSEPVLCWCWCCASLAIPSRNTPMQAKFDQLAALAEMEDKAQPYRIVMMGDSTMKHQFGAMCAFLGERPGRRFDPMVGNGAMRLTVFTRVALRSSRRWPPSISADAGWPREDRTVLSFDACLLVAFEVGSKVSRVAQPTAQVQIRGISTRSTNMPMLSLCGSA